MNDKMMIKCIVLFWLSSLFVFSSFFDIFLPSVLPSFLPSRLSQRHPRPLSLFLSDRQEGVCCIGGAYTAHCKKCSSKTGACDDGSCDYAYEYREGTCKRVLTKVEWILAGSLAGGLGLCLLISIFRCLATKSARSRHSASANNVGRWAQESQGREDGRALLPSPSAQVVQPDGVYE